MIDEFPFCMRTGWRPSSRDLTDAPVIEQWRLLSMAPATRILIGWLGGKAFVESVVAADTDAGWARLAERWVILGDRALVCPSRDIDWNERLRHDPLPNDAERMIAWAKRNLFDEEA
jgi:hypothetical protein